MDLARKRRKDQRQQIWQYLSERKVELCAVTKGRSVLEVAELLEDLPELKIIGENRWPDCQDNFAWAKDQGLKRHFIGNLQKNKVNKVVPLVDCVQSVDSWELLVKIDQGAADLGRVIDFMWQVNVSADQQKFGLTELELAGIVARVDLANVNCVGLMTIGAIADQKQKQQYFQRLAELTTAYKLPICSMGMSQDYRLAIESGATMVRLGGCLF